MRLYLVVHQSKNAAEFFPSRSKKIYSDRNLIPIQKSRTIPETLAPKNISSVKMKQQWDKIGPLMIGARNGALGTQVLFGCDASFLATCSVAIFSLLIPKQRSYFGATDGAARIIVYHLILRRDSNPRH